MRRSGSYLHNRGDVFMVLVPVLAGALVLATDRPVLDPVIAGAVALWLAGTTVHEVLRSREDLLWPERIPCDASPALPESRQDRRP